MFCTHCGTQLDDGKNFCKSCGARAGHAAAASQGAAMHPIEPGAGTNPADTPSRRTGALSPRHESGAGKRLVIVAAGVAVIVLGGAGVYFGTDLMKPAGSPEPLKVAEPMTQNTEAPPLPSFEDSRDPVSPPADSAASVDAPPAPSADDPKAPVENPPASAPRADLPPAPTPSQMQRAGQDAPPPGRAPKSQPPVSASRGGAPAGIYETRRATSVHEEPSASAKTVASIPQGTRVNVVSSSGDWLEVHSKRGNPPGFIRRDDAAFIEKSN